MSYIILANVSGQNKVFGAGQIGIEVRRNRLIANKPNVTSVQEDYAAHEGYSSVVRVETPQPQLDVVAAQVGPIFQDNACEHCERPFTVGSGVAGAIFAGNAANPQAGRDLVRVLDVAGRLLSVSPRAVVR